MSCIRHFPLGRNGVLLSRRVFGQRAAVAALLEVSPSKAQICVEVGNQCIQSMHSINAIKMQITYMNKD